MLALVTDPGSSSGVTLREVPDPLPRPDEALVELRAVSLNRGEVRRLASQPAGIVPGWDVAGVVVEQAQDASGPSSGARVVGLVARGAWAQLAAVPTSTLATLPTPVSFAAASTLPVAGLTAYRALSLGGLLLGKRVLVTGAAGGVGRFAIQLAKGAGAHVTAVIGSPERSQGLTDLGADEIVVDFASEGLPFDLLLESVGGRSLAAALARVAPAGTIVSFGNSSGEPTEFDVSSFYRHGAGARLYAFLVFDDLRHAGSGTHDLELLAGLVAEGALDPQISLETHWHEPEEAFRALIERRVLGKAVLRVD